MENKIIICCLCNEEITDVHGGNNAAPLKDGNCCDPCNIMRVIPERIKRSNEKT